MIGTSTIVILLVTVFVLLCVSTGLMVLSAWQLRNEKRQMRRKGNK